MIPELDRYHGTVLRQIVVGQRSPIAIGVADIAGRVDTFSVNTAAVQIKHSSKRLSPWRFTYAPENVAELHALSKTYAPVWIFLVCGQDGVVGITLEELTSILLIADGNPGWIRVARSRNAMYRIAGANGELARAKPRGVQPFLSEAFPHGGPPDAGLPAEAQA